MTADAVYCIQKPLTLVKLSPRFLNNARFYGNATVVIGFIGSFDEYMQCQPGNGQPLFIELKIFTYSELPLT